MLKTYLYIPDDLDKKIKSTAKRQNKSKAEVIRVALEKGIKNIEQQNNVSAQALFKLAEIGKLNKLSGPKDSSERMNDLLWAKDWSQDE